MYSCVDLDLCTGALSSWKKIPIPKEMSGKDWSQVFLKNFLIFERVYIPFDWRHSSHALPTDASPYHDLKIILFSFFLNEVRSPTFVSFSRDPDSFIITDHNLGFIGKKSHASSCLQSKFSFPYTKQAVFYD